MVSGVYFPKMQLPKNCKNCDLVLDLRASMYCPVSGDFVSYDDTPESAGCPGIQIADHGRLVDADALAKRIKDEGRHQAEYYADRYAPVVLAYADCYGKVESAPTIIHAEEGEA